MTGWGKRKTEENGGDILFLYTKQSMANVFYVIVF